MKVTVYNKVAPSITYPCLGMYTNDQSVVLFTSVDTGTVLKKGYLSREVGYWSKTWNDSWVLFDDNITLSNED